MDLNEDEKLPEPIQLQDGSIPLDALHPGAAPNDVLLWTGTDWISAPTGAPVNAVSGPGSATLTALARWNNTNGRVLSDSTVTLSDLGFFNLVKSSSDISATTDYKIGTDTILSTDKTLNNLFLGIDCGSSTGSGNTGIGQGALNGLVDGGNNSVFGNDAANILTSGSSNLIMGHGAGQDLTTGSGNVLLGAGSTAGDDAAINRIVLGGGASGQYDNALHIAGGVTKFWFSSLESTTPLDKVLYFDDATGLIKQGELTPHPTTFLDDEFRILSHLDVTAQLAFNCEYITTSTTRTVTAVNNPMILPAIIGTSIGLGKTSYSSSLTRSTVIGITTANSLTTGTDNTLFGYAAGYSNIAGNYITAVGSYAAYFTTASDITAVGYQSLYSNTLGQKNVSVGQAAYSNTTGSYNTTMGYQASNNNVVGSYVSSYGYQALRANLTDSMSAFGYQSLTSNTTGIQNSAFGYLSLTTNITGSSNVAFGYQALMTANTDGNSAFGTNALELCNSDDNTAIGRDSLNTLTTGINNTSLGSHSGIGLVSGSNNILLGYNTTPYQSSTTGSIVIGANVAGKRAIPTTNGNNVLTIMMPSANAGAYCNAFRQASGSFVLNYNNSTNEITYAAGGGGGGNTFLDDVFRVQNVDDTTKQFALNCANITTETTRTWTVPNFDGILPGLDANNNIILGLTQISDMTLRLTLIGYLAGENVLSATDSVFVGYQAGQNVTTAVNNVLIGSDSATLLTTGGDNVVVGYGVVTLAASANSVLIGSQVDNGGNNNIIIGKNNTSAYDNSIVIGSDVSPNNDDQIVIGATTATSLRVFGAYGQTTANPYQIAVVDDDSFISTISTIPLSLGGTNNNITASAGALVYSNASQLALTAVGVSGQILVSNGTAAPSWTTAKYPVTVGAVGTILRSNGTDWVATTSTFADTYSVNTILYAGTANTITGLATANNSVLVTSVSGVPSLSQTLPSAVQLNITQLSTISTGVWQGTAIGLTYGGTGGSLTASDGGIVYSDATRLRILSATVTANKMLLSGASTTPSWSTSTIPTSSGVSGKILISDGTNYVLSTPTYPTSASTAGKLIRSDGSNLVMSTSTFADTYTNNALLYSNGANNVASLAVGSSGQVLVSGGPTVAPAWTTLSSIGVSSVAGTTNQILVNGATTAASGAVTISLPAAVTIATSVTISALTPGSILFAGTSGLISQDNSNLFWNDATNRLGIGTIFPDSTLNVSGALFSSTFPYNVNFNDSASMAIDVGGGVGFSGNDGSTNNRMFGLIQGAKENATSSNYDGYLRFFTRVNGNGSMSERMRITSAGNVGIATTSPTSLFSVGSSSQFQVNGSGQVVSGSWQGSIIGLTYGGTNAALTASNGGIVWSNATQLQILAGVAAANRVLLSGNSATPAWSSATYPASTTINQILYSSSANTIGGITTANNGVLITSAAGVPSFLAAGTTGQVLIATTGSPASWGTLSGIAVTSIAGTTNQINASASTGAVTLTLSSTIVTPGTLAINGLTTGSILFSGASSVVSQNNGQLFWDNTNTRLGIGTTLPQNKLDVSGALAVGSYAGVNAAPSNGAIISGNVGMGTSSPGAPLEVYRATAGVQELIRVTNFNTGTTSTSDLNFRLGTSGTTTTFISNLWNGAQMCMGMGAGSPASELVRILGSSRFFGVGTIFPQNTFNATNVQYSTGTATQSGTTVTGIGTTFTSAMVGSIFVFTTAGNNLSSGVITGFTNSTTITVTTTNTVAVATTYAIYYAGLNVTSTGLVGVATTSPTQALEIGGTNAQIYLNSATSNMLYYNTNGLAIPSFTTRSAGTKIVLFPAVNASSADYAIGMSSSILWFSVATTSNNYIWYGGVTEWMRLSTVGLGIGVIPTSRLHVTGTIASSTDTSVAQAGVNLSPAVNPTGAVTNVIGTYLSPTFSVAGGTIVNAYGMLINTFSVASTGINYGLGVTTPTSGASNYAALFTGATDASVLITTSTLGREARLRLWASLDNAPPSNSSALVQFANKNGGADLPDNCWYMGLDGNRGSTFSPAFKIGFGGGGWASFGTTDLFYYSTTGQFGIGNIPQNTLSVSPTQYSTGTASQTLTTVTGVGVTFTSAMIGSQITYLDGTFGGTITAVPTSTTLTVTTSQSVSSQAYRINYPGLQVTSAGLVGVNTISPTQALHLVGSSTSQALFQNTTAATTNSFQASPALLVSGTIWNPSSGNKTMSGGLQMGSISATTNPSISKLSFLVGTDSTSATEAMYLSSAPNILTMLGGADFTGSTLSTSNSVWATNRAAATSGAAQSSNTLGVRGRSWSSTSGDSITQGYMQMINITNNANPTVDRLAFFVSSAAASAVEEMCITSQGRLGVNTTAPTAALHVVGTDGTCANIFSTAGGSSSESSVIAFNRGTIGYNKAASGVTGGVEIGMYAGGSANLALSTGGGEELRMLNTLGLVKIFANTSEVVSVDGPNLRVGINTTSPAYTLEATGTAGTHILVASDGTAKGSIYVSNSATSAIQIGSITSHQIGFCVAAGTPSVVLTTNNVFGIGTQTPGTVSRCTISSTNAYNTLITGTQTAQTSNQQIALYCNSTLNPTLAVTGYIAGLSLEHTIASTAATTVANAYGAFIAPAFSTNAGIITSAIGLRISSSGAGGAGTISSATGLLVATPLYASAAATVYGVQISGSDNAAATNGTRRMLFLSGTITGDDGTFASGVHIQNTFQPTNNTRQAMGLYLRPVVNTQSTNVITAAHGAYMDLFGSVASGGTITESYTCRILCPAIGSARYGLSLEGNSTDTRYIQQITGTIYGDSTACQGLRIDCTLEAKTNSQSVFGIRCVTTASVVSTNNIPQHVALYAQATTNTVGSGSITSAYSGYFDNPGAGATTSTTALYTANLVVGSSYVSVTPPANGAIISGNVGIGTSSPLEKFSVLDTISITSAASPTNGYMRIVSTTGGANYIQSGLALSSGSAAPLIFCNIYYVNEWMRITSTGQLGIGTGGTVSARLHSLATTEQLRLGYDASNYTSFTVSSAGNLTVAPSGTSTTITGYLTINNTSNAATVINAGSATMVGGNVGTRWASYSSTPSITYLDTAFGLFNFYSAPAVTLPAGVSTSARLYGYVAEPSITAPASATAALTDFRNFVSSTATVTSNTSAAITVSNWSGMFINIPITKAGVGTVAVTNLYGANIIANAVSGYTCTNQYGLYIGAMTNATNNYGLISMSALNGFGTATPTQAIEIGGTAAQIYMNSATSNMIQFNTNGLGAPTFTTNRSIGTKLIIYPAFLNGSRTDYAIGMESNRMWFSVETTAQGFKWYGGITEWMQLNNTGLGVGTGATVSAKIHSLATTEQLRLGFDANNYVSFTTSSSGGLTIAPVSNAAGNGANIALTSAMSTNATTAINVNIGGTSAITGSSGQNRILSLGTAYTISASVTSGTMVPILTFASVTTGNSTTITGMVYDGIWTGSPSTSVGTSSTITYSRVSGIRVANPMTFSGGVTATNIVTNKYGILVEAINSTGSTTTNAYGIYVNNPTTSTSASSSVGIYTDSLLVAFDTTATANGTTTLTNQSRTNQYFTGTTSNQTVVLPVTTTLFVGYTFNIHNRTSSGTLTVNSSGSNLVATITAGNSAIITCTTASGTSATSWDVLYDGGSSPGLTSNSFIRTSETITSSTSLSTTLDSLINASTGVLACTLAAGSTDQIKLVCLLNRRSMNATVSCVASGGGTLLLTQSEPSRTLRYNGTLACWQIESGFSTTSPDSFFPTTQQGTKLVGTGGTSAQFQGIVALSADGNTLAVGGQGDNSSTGAVWIFTRSGTTWTQQGTKLVGTGNTASSTQGTSVALSADGNTLAVGGSGDNTSVGATWIFTRSGTTWTQQGTKLVGTGATGASTQGQSVILSADGNTLAVGGDSDNTNVGAVWIFTRSGTTWTQQGTKLVGTGTSGTQSKQGASLAISSDGNTLAVGANQDGSGNGATWIFTRSITTWTQQGTKLVGTGTAALFPSQGTSVALSADGTTLASSGSGDNSGNGAIWIFARSYGTWTQVGNKLTATGNTGAASFGRSIALTGDGNVLIASGTSDNSSAGATWVFIRSNNSWFQQGNKLVGTGSTGGSQGTRVAISSNGNTIAIGAQTDNSNVGATWIFT